eukprot:SAG31_NODE_638_length_13329_cov_13.538095_11_plen_110_part_00
MFAGAAPVQRETCGSKLVWSCSPRFTDVVVRRLRGLGPCKRSRMQSVHRALCESTFHPFDLSVRTGKQEINWDQLGLLIGIINWDYHLGLSFGIINWDHYLGSIGTNWD